MAASDIKDLLLAQRLERPAVADLLAPYGLRDILDELLICVSGSANPDQALTYFERFVRASTNKTHLFSYLKISRQALEILAKCLGGSIYMAEILIRDPHSGTRQIVGVFAAQFRGV